MFKKKSHFAPKSGFLATLDLFLSWKVSRGSDAAASLEADHVSSSLPRSPCSRNGTCFPSLRRELGPQRHLSLRTQPQADMETPAAQLPSGLEAEAFTGLCSTALGGALNTPPHTPKWYRGDHTGCPDSHSTALGLKSLDNELYGHLTCWFPRASQLSDLYLLLALAWELREVMGVQGISGAGKMPLGFLVKFRILSGTHQLALKALGWGRGLGEPTLTPLGLIVVTMS